MKKLIVPLVFAASIAGAQFNSATAGVLDQCIHTGQNAWKCSGMPGDRIDTWNAINAATDSASSWWWRFYKDWFEDSI